MKLTPESADAVKRLRTNTDFRTFLSVIGDFGEKLVEQMIYTQEDSQLRTLQGEARAVAEILKAVETAPEKFKD